MAKKEVRKKKEGCCKGFFKLTIVKIVLTIVFTALLFILFSPTILIMQCSGCGGYISYGIFNLFGSRLSSEMLENFQNLNNYILVIMFLIKLIISYILSCLIIFSYNKIRNK